MPGYQPVSVIAAGLQTDEATLLDFQRKGWIQAVTRNEIVYVAADQRYRAKYILYLQQTKHLNDDQIQVVLSRQLPPYSATEVEEILKHYSSPPNARDAGA
jgi:hypothetical protein